MKTVEVVAAIVIDKNRILCTKRDFSDLDYISYKWEFPGGKIESGETEEEALKREIVEELDLKINSLEKYLTVEHSYPDFKLIMHSYKATSNPDHIKLKEHIAYKWLSKNEISKLDWAAADLPIVDKLRGE